MVYTVTSQGRKEAGAVVPGRDFRGSIFPWHCTAGNRSRPGECDLWTAACCEPPLYGLGNPHGTLSRVVIPADPQPLAACSDAHPGRHRRVMVPPLCGKELVAH